MRAFAYGLYAFCDDLPEFLFAELIDAIGTTLASGALDAWAVDGMREEGDHAPKDRFFARSLVLARTLMVASGIAASGGFDVEEVQDVRIAIDELCSALIEAGRGEVLRLSFDRDPDGLAIVGSTPAGPGTVDPDRFELSRQLLSVVVSEHSIDLGGDEIVFSMRKARGDEPRS